MYFPLWFLFVLLFLAANADSCSCEDETDSEDWY